MTVTTKTRHFGKKIFFQFLQASYKSTFLKRRKFQVHCLFHFDATATFVRLIGVHEIAETVIFVGVGTTQSFRILHPGHAAVKVDLLLADDRIWSVFNSFYLSERLHTAYYYPLLSKVW